MIWDDPGGCDHEWEATVKPKGNGSGTSFRRDKEAWEKRGGIQPGFCAKCGAWCGSLGLEPTPDLFVKHIVQVFREVRRVLKKDGTLWLNLGDSYATGAGKVGEHPGGGEQGRKWADSNQDPKRTAPRPRGPMTQPNRMPLEGLKPKDLCEIPSDVVRALRADGWWLRYRIPWIKRNGMPGSEKDRPTVLIEYVFLLSKSERYFYDYEAVKLPAALDSHARYARGRSDEHKWSDGGPGDQTIARSMEHMRKPSNWHTSENYKGQYPPKPGVTPKAAPAGSGIKANDSFQTSVKDTVETRARRGSDWFFESLQGLLSNEDGDPLAFIVNSQGFKGTHFATFPMRLVEPMIKAGSREGDIVVDPFLGSGTAAIECEKLKRRWIGMELSTEYCEMAKDRIQKYLWGETEPGQERLFDPMKQESFLR